MLSMTILKPAPFHLGVGPFAATLKRNLYLALSDVGKSVHNTVRKPIPRHTGADSLYNQIKYERPTTALLTTRTFTSSKKAIFREVNTKPHEIWPKKSGTKLQPKLRWVKRGKVYFAAHVNHPGTKGTHSWQHGATAMRMRLPWAYKYAVEAALKMSTYQKRYS